MRVAWGSEITRPETSCPWFPLCELGGMASNAAEKQECSQRYTEHKLCSSFFIHVYTVPQHRQLHCLTVSAISYIVRTAWSPREPPWSWHILWACGHHLPQGPSHKFWQHVCALHMLHNWILTLLWSTEERMRGIEEELRPWITELVMKQSMTVFVSDIWKVICEWYWRLSKELLRKSILRQSGVQGIKHIIKQRQKKIN